mmetsp:Transcript_19696/g.39182  ORF Transcript_19696/g.39182 Transcript_19696/m.39182 type:complete len:199 (+) Transcript_19696:421-1017(+)
MVHGMVAPPKSFVGTAESGREHTVSFFVKTHSIRCLYNVFLSPRLRNYVISNIYAPLLLSRRYIQHPGRYLPPGVISKYAQTVCIFALWATLHKISSSTDLLRVRKLSTPEREKIDRHCAAAAGTAAGNTPTVLPWYRRALLFRSVPLDRTLRTRVFVVSLLTFLTDVLLVSSLYPMVCVLINGWKWGVLEAGIGTTT